jgi:hypothetical protein
VNQDRRTSVHRIAHAMGGRGLEGGDYYVGRVARISSDGTSAEIQIGNRSAQLSIATTRWAHKPNPEAYYPTALIDRLESSGFVVRQADPVDRRVKRVYVTKQARGFLEKLRKETDPTKVFILQAGDSIFVPESTF